MLTTSVDENALSDDGVTKNVFHISVETVLDRLHKGCVDSKLAVRLQAMWALGNLTLCVLPLRKFVVLGKRDVTTLSSSNLKLLKSVTDDSWEAIWLVCESLVDDSEKVYLLFVIVLSIIVLCLSWCCLS